ncbi:MAG: 1-acyl-sn-glycerol-3-phosphate acyltransferase, partial [Cyclobacteriaceae bacterium]|nr:1-acyl-sn-glycerol-3-phosphate acyltransferase [Cyclobacteriaceae bacterium]
APSKFGLIRDVGGVEGLSFGVGTMELLMFLGVLIGQLTAGLVSDMGKGVTLTLSVFLLGLALVGWISSKRIKVKEESVDSDIEDSVLPHLFLIRTAKWAKTVKGLNTTIIGIGVFWFNAALLQMNIYEHVPKVYGLSNTGTAVIMALLSIGIGLGCWVAGMLSKNRVELGMAPLGGLGLSVILTIFSTVELGLYSFVFALFMAAFFIGFYKVPLSAWIQERVHGRKLGKALAYNQLVGFLFILLSAFVFWLCTHFFDTYSVFVVLAFVSWLMTIVTMINIPAMMLRFVVYILTRFYFKLEIVGLENIPKQSGALIVANHVSLLDSFIIAATVPRMVRFVMDRSIYEFFLWKGLMKRLNMVPVSRNMGKEKLTEFNQLCKKEVMENHILCIFPEGQVSRIGHLLEFKKGIEHIAEGTGVPIIPVHIEGLRGTPFSFQIGESKPVMPGFKGFKKRIVVNIGKQVPADSPAYLLRQEVQLLNTASFERKIQDHQNLHWYMKKSAGKFKHKTFMTEHGGRSINFATFFKESTNCTSYWASVTDMKIAVEGDDTIDHYIAVASLVLAGKIPLFLPASLMVEEREKVMKKHEVGVYVGSKSLQSPNVVNINIHDFVAANKNRKPVSEVKDNKIAGIFMAKGPDHKPMEISLSHQNIIATVKGLKGIFKIPEKGVLLSDIPLSVSYGNILKGWLSYFLGIKVCLSDTGNMKENVEVIKREGVNTLFVDASYVERLYDVMPVDLWHQIDYVIIGRDPVEAGIAERLMTEFNVGIYQSMGFKAGGTVVAVNTPDYSLTGITGKTLVQHGSKQGSFGRPLPGLTVKAVHPKHYEQTLVPGEKGMLLARGSGIVSPDYNKNGQEYFDGWLVTGEYGYIDDTGFLFVDPKQE